MSSALLSLSPLSSQCSCSVCRSIISSVDFEALHLRECSYYGLSLSICCRYLVSVFCLQGYHLCYFLFLLVLCVCLPAFLCVFLIACLLFTSCFYYVSLCIVGPYSLMQVSVTTCVSGYCLLSVISASSSHHHHPRISFVCFSPFAPQVLL